MEHAHGVTYHGGFNVKDKVEVFDPWEGSNGEWSVDVYTIGRFDGMSVYVIADDGHSKVVDISHIRHPHLVREN